jgi:hypothetical protein
VALAAFLDGDDAPATTAPAATSSAVVAPRSAVGEAEDRDDLSEDELAALLARRLERLR